MIKVSTKGRYGLNAVYALSQAKEGQPLSIKQISEGTSVPLPYLEQILIQLRKNGYVNSTRGAKGGYALAKAPQEINIYELLLILEGEILPIHCKNGKSCASMGNAHYCCAGEIVWNKISTALIDAIGSYTIQDLINDFKQ